MTDSNHALSKCYVCPETKQPLFEIYEQGNLTGLITKHGKRYCLKNGILDLTYPENLEEQDLITRDFYDKRVEAYDEHLHLTFDTHGVDENTERNEFINRLNIKHGDRVLDIACGTGRDSILIAQRLSQNDELYCQDISPNMIKRCSEKLSNYPVKKNFCLSNAINLPYPDNFFDATYSFGALGEFSDIAAALREMVRVTKKNGKIVVGDESIPPWLRHTDFSKILITTNPQFSAHLPLEHMPVEARNTRIQWVIGGVFYLIDFRVGDGEPSANFDIPIPGQRGGTYRTRFEGQLEGVTPETKALAYKAIEQMHTDMHSWLDKTIREAAQSALEKD